MWWWPSIYNCIRIDPNEVVKLSSFEGCILYVLSQNTPLHPDTLQYLSEQEFQALNKDKPRYVSCSKRCRVSSERSITRFGDVIISVKIIEGDKDQMLYTTSFHRCEYVSPERIKGLLFQPDVWIFGFPVGNSLELEIECIVLDVNSQDYKKFVKIDMMYREGIMDVYLTYLEKLNVYSILELGLNINVVETLVYNLLEKERTRIETLD